MSTLPPFAWSAHPTQPDMTCCLWNGITLHAWKTGEWKVIKDFEVLTHWEEQTTGKNIKDAQRRAQAAAMVHHSLRKHNSK